MEVSVFIAADYANLTNDGKMNVMGIFTSIRATKFPAAHNEMYLILQLVADPSEYDREFEVNVRLINEDASETPVDINLSGKVPHNEEGRRVDIVQLFRLQRIVFSRPGIYEFKVRIDRDHKVSLPLYVEQISIPSDQE
jgi:hypothetical protein